MRKLLLILVILLSLNSVFAEYEDRVPRTKTIIDSTLLHSIRNGCHPNSSQTDYAPIMRQYWCYYIGISDTILIRDLDDRGERGEVFHTDEYVKEAFWGVIGHDTDQHGDDNDTPDEILELARLHLLDSSFLHYLSLESVFEYFGGSTGVSTSRRGLDFGYILDNVAFMVDMLWEYTGHGGNQDDYHADLLYPLEELAEYGNWLLINSRPNGHNPEDSYLGPGIDIEEHPALWVQNYRIRFAAILGYAGCVLDSTTYINTALDDLFYYDEPGQLPDSGYFDLFVSNSGVYLEGMSYTNYTCQSFPMFFNTYKRMGYENLYEREGIKDVFENSLDLIMPDFNMISTDDSYFSTYSKPYFFSELVNYYYQSDIENQEMEWFLTKHYDSFSKYPNPSRLYKAVLSFNPDRTIGTGTFPTNLANGTYSNEEITILRNPVISFDEYMQDVVGTGTTLIVNHENTLSLSGHEHGDQSSFQLYYKGKQLLTDPGYRPDLSEGFFNVGKEWLLSPFAHNLILVNPDTIRENSELRDDYWDIYDGLATEPSYPFNPNLYYEPVGFHGSVSNYELKNPCYKNYLIKEGNTEHMQVEVVYDHQQNSFMLNETYPNQNASDVITIKRNFYSFNNNEYYVIFDDVVSDLVSNQNVFCNQLHFGATELDTAGNHQDFLNLEDNGKFTYQFYDSDLTSDIYLHGAMGSQNNSIDFLPRDHLPQGVYLKELTSGPEWEHRDLRLFTETTGDEKFLTILFPSEEDMTPFYEYTEDINENGVYAVDLAQNGEYNGYLGTFYTAIGINGTGESYQYWANSHNVETDAEFFSLKYHDPARLEQPLIHLIVNNGSMIEYKNIVAYQSQVVYDEMLANYTDNDELHITFKMDKYPPNPVPNPKYKILRQNIEVENLFSKTEYVTINGDEPNEPHERGTIENNIVELAYDENYFYVNYTFTELQIPENLSIEILDSELILSWDSVLGANSYKVFVADSPYGTFSQISVYQSEFFVDGNRVSWSHSVIDLRKFYNIKASTDNYPTRE